MHIYEANYQRLLKLVPDLKSIREYRKLSAEGFMDLSIDILSRDKNRRRVALSHTYKHPSGDLIPDPDMELEVDFDAGTVEALSYQDATVYRVVYPEAGVVAPKAKKELNQFLTVWLKNLQSQGHR